MICHLKLYLFALVLAYGLTSTSAHAVIEADLPQSSGKSLRGKLYSSSTVVREDADIMYIEAIPADHLLPKSSNRFPDTFPSNASHAAHIDLQDASTGMVQGLYYNVANGCDTSCLTTASYVPSNTILSTGFAIEFANIQSATNNYVLGSNGYAVMWFGYLYASSTQGGTWTITLKNTDDNSYVWFGSNAISGYTSSNANVAQVCCTNTNSFSINLTAGQNYPIRIFWGDKGVGAYTLTVQFTPPGGSAFTNGANSLYTCAAGMYSFSGRFSLI